MSNRAPTVPQVHVCLVGRRGRSLARLRCTLSPGEHGSLRREPCPPSPGVGWIAQRALRPRVPGMDGVPRGPCSTLGRGLGGVPRRPFSTLTPGDHDASPLMRSEAFCNGKWVSAHDGATFSGEYQSKLGRVRFDSVESHGKRQAPRACVCVCVQVCECACLCVCMRACVCVCVFRSTAPCFSVGPGTRHGDRARPRHGRRRDGRGDRGGAGGVQRLERDARPGEKRLWGGGGGAGRGGVGRGGAGQGGVGRAEWGGVGWGGVGLGWGRAGGVGRVRQGGAGWARVAGRGSLGETVHHVSILLTSPRVNLADVTTCEAR